MYTDEVEARYWASEEEAAAAEVVSVVDNLGASGVPQARARYRERRAREMIEAGRTEGKAQALSVVDSCVRGPGAWWLRQRRRGKVLEMLTWHLFPLTLLSAAPRVVPVEDVEDLSHVPALPGQAHNH